ncbi:unnamed protein product [Clonostachys solani]|uniref:Uncharacterized protein n=1 Tax=Clonostachys solani TaxID=160281 RepID=A0A9N9Z9D4_9HYPO|nr:unnamed protein product [Clonostachys solani]
MPPKLESPARSPRCNVGCRERFLLLKETFYVIPNIQIGKNSESLIDGGSISTPTDHRAVLPPFYSHFEAWFGSDPGSRGSRGPRKYVFKSGDTEITIPISEPREKGPDISLLPDNESSLPDTQQLLREAARTSQQFPASSPHIYQHHGRKKAKPWFGKPWEVRVPEILETKWSEAGGIKERLDLDLEPTRIQLTRKASKRKCRRSEREFNAELRMSGAVDPRHPHTVTLFPHVWIFCGSEWALKVIEKALRSISWIEGFLNRPVEFCIGGIELCGLETVIPLEELQKYAVPSSSLRCSGGDVLFHFAKLRPRFTSLSACGWLCCATYLKDNTVRNQRLSRIGGILTSGILDECHKHHLGTILTVAHGLLDEEEDDLDEVYSSYNDSLPSDSESDSEDSYDSEESEMMEPLPGSSPRLGQLDPSEIVLQWISFDEVCGINCFGKIVQNEQPPRDSPTNRSDYALLRSHTLQHLHNTYTTSSTAQEAGSWEAITSYSSNSEMKDGRVCIILGLGQVEEAWLLPGSQPMRLEGGQVTVRKLQLRLPLAQGTSGSWVVKDHTWYGMIVAAYVGEPLAVFITAEDILSDMKSSFPSLGETTLRCSEIVSEDKSSQTEGLNATPPINEDDQFQSLLALLPLDDTNIDYDENEDELSDISDLEGIYKPDEDPDDNLVETYPRQLSPKNPNFYEIPEAIYAGFKRLQPEMDPNIKADVDNICMDEDQGPDWYNPHDVYDFLEWERRYL